MVVEIGVTAINTDKLNIWTRPTLLGGNEIAQQMEMWKMAMFNVHELYENEPTLWDICMVYENMLNTTEWIF